MGVGEYAGSGRRYGGVPTPAVMLSPRDTTAVTVSLLLWKYRDKKQRFLLSRLWLGIWVRRAIMGTVFDSESCWPPPVGQPHLSLLALGYSVIAQETTLAASASAGFIPPRPSTSHFLNFTQIIYLFPMILLPPVPWSNTIQPCQGLTSLQGALPKTTVFIRIQHKEGRVTGTKKMMHAIYQTSPLCHF